MDRTARPSRRVLGQLFGGRPGPAFFPPAICAKHNPTGYSPLILPYHCPSEEEPPFPNGRCDTLAFRLLEGLGVREVDVVGTTLETKDSPENFEMRLSERVIVSRVEAPRHTPAQQGLNHLGLQHADLPAERGDRQIVYKFGLNRL